VNLKVGDRVEWTSQAAGIARTKRGVVIWVVKPGERPVIPNFGAVRGAGMPRNEESYVVRAGGRLYWPRVSQLRAADERKETP
jgi:hypothetical protein